MKTSKKTVFTGSAIAMAAAALAACSDTPAQSTDATTTDLAHCYGVNSCKGHNDCQTADHACGGQGSCKGTGFVAMPTKACTDIGGVVKDEWRGEASVAELSHCYDVNLCKGHNDCATANNACKGQASCKGTGFVLMGEKACKDVGGKTGS
ncbi:Uncharacterised protein [BD1-7 clade bacterium]|uniref:Lipoprotein n=1 Tax=BD1-7 clade bacterium TaxID=2029982 RepID=A0A5S9NBP6_9GAMM|nr:Uncharacterised protein [BD1-7 clade bacterium]CAA0085668.1 Uncharacterised protein [BD1-7 clade bacterium]